MLHRDYFRRPDSSLSRAFAPQGLFPPSKCISVSLFCSTGITSAVRIHLYLALLLHRDYFHRPDASLSCSFAPQGLFPPAKCISISLFCSTGIITAGQMHLYLALLLHRDYFHQPDASLSCSFVPQGLFCPGWMHLYLALFFHRDDFHRPDASLSSSFAPQRLFPQSRCISISLFCSTGIISTGQMHLYLALLLHRDYFRRPDASLSCSFVPQGLFCPGQIHLYLALLFHRDYFRRPDSSLSRSFAPQGLFPPSKCISILLFCSTGIISTSRMHLYLALLSHRDYFAPAGCISILLFSSTGMISTGRMHLYLPLLLHRDYFRSPDASLSRFFAPQGLFPPAKCISILRFCSTGIIWAARMHLYLALLFHKDYFGRPNASLSCSFVTQGLFPPAKYISILHFCSTGIISAGRIHLYLALLLHRDYFHRPNASLSCSFEPIARLSAVPFT